MEIRSKIVDVQVKKGIDGYSVTESTGDNGAWKTGGLENRSRDRKS